MFKNKTLWNWLLDIGIFAACAVINAFFAVLYIGIMLLVHWYLTRH